MVRENAAAKARRYLTEGRVILTEVSPGRIGARVRGDGSVYDIRFQDGHWSCDCPALTDQCSHLRAIRLVVAPEVAW